MNRRLLTALTVAIALVAVLVVHPAVATHPTEAARPPRDGARVVHVGGGDLRNQVVTDLEVQFMAYYPETMQVHRGQTVEWRFAPGFATFHTVTFLPADMDASARPEPLESGHRPIVRADETPETVALSEDLMLGTGCGLIHPNGADGRPAQDPCHITSTSERYGSQLSDAFFNINRVQPQSFAATIDLPPGLYRYHCNFHSEMHGYIEVVEDDVALPTQEAIDAKARLDLEGDLATAVELHKASSVPQSVIEGDQRVWLVNAGATSDDRRVTINDYMPAELEVEPGDAVRFVAAGDEPQTVTFPAESVGSFSLQGCDMSTCEGDFAPVGLVLPAFPWACEFDEPATGLPGLPLWAPTRGCPDGGLVEWQFGPHSAEATPAPGNLVATEQTFHNSAMMFGGSPHLPTWATERPGPRDFASSFDAVFPAEGSFTFACLIHPGKVATERLTGAKRQGMVGTIRVRQP